MVKKKKAVEISKSVVKSDFIDDFEPFIPTNDDAFIEDVSRRVHELQKREAVYEDNLILDEVHELKKRIDSIQEDVNLLIKHAMPNGELGKRFYKFVKDNAFNRKCKDTFKVWAG
jgi:hypothetical protein